MNGCIKPTLTLLKDGIVCLRLAINYISKNAVINKLFHFNSILDQFSSTTKSTAAINQSMKNTTFKQQ